MAVHQHLIIRAEIDRPPMNHCFLERLTRTAQRDVEIWMESLIDKIDMKIMYGPKAMYCNKVGNRGMTAFAIIETSHLALHTWDEGRPTMQLDVYTCSELDLETVFRAIGRFKPTRIEYKFLDRETQLVTVGRGMRSNHRALSR